jgi:predicted nucleotidyltransferase
MVDIEAARQYYYERERRRRAQRNAEQQQWLRHAREAILRLVEHYPEVRRVYIFGSLVKPGRFRPDSDIDVAVECDTIETESAFWRALEQELKRVVAVRPLVDAIAETVADCGELIYERHAHRSHQ